MPEAGVFPTDAPSANTLECSLFGPGVGECVVLHIGAGKWLVVDSCRIAGRRAVALEYLAAIGVDPNAISLVVATHWHDDHIGGLAEIVSEARAARFACSAALNQKEFFTLIKSAPTVADLTRHGSGVDEMYKILMQLRGSGQQADWTQHHQTLYRDDATEVVSLSPAAATLEKALVGFAEFAPKFKAALKTVPQSSPNETCVVLHVRFGHATILLGSDLENTPDENRGWKAIVSSDRRPTSLAGVFKVAHHGSHNADHPDIWTKLATPPLVAAITPFTRSGLPRDSDLARIKGRASRVFVTSSSSTKPLKRPRAVAAVVERDAKKPPRPMAGKMGQIRVRMDTATGSLTDVELFGAAFVA